MCLFLYQIDTNVGGKRLLHGAIIEGQKPMVKVLLKHNPDIESEVSQLQCMCTSITMQGFVEYCQQILVSINA